MRPLSSPALRFTRACISGEIHSGCSSTKRYMSATYRAPSGPIRRVVGRNQGSVLARNSDCSSPTARWLCRALPRVLSTSRWITLCTGSLMKTDSANSSPKRSSRYGVGLQPLVTWFNDHG